MKNYLILLLLGLTGCGSATDAMNATKGMPDLMNRLRTETNENMSKTNRAIHMQTLSEALDKMLSEENSRFLNPPTGMLPGGQIFADEATPDELVKLVYVYYRDIAETTLEEWIPKKNSEGKWTREALLFDHKKQAKLTALMVIAGLTSQEKAEKLISENIPTGEYEPQAYNFLALRALFIKTYIIEQRYFAYKLTNPGMFEKALEYMRQIDFIVKLPFVDKVKMQTMGLLQQELNLNISVSGSSETNIFESGNPLSLWQHLARSFENELEQPYQINGLGEPKSTMSPEMLNRMKNIKASIDKGLAGWTH